MHTLPTRILLTGAGGPAAISFFRSLSDHASFDFYMADMDPLAQGLYMVDAAKRHIIPAGQAADFVDRLLELCQREHIHVLVPTVDAELLAIARRRQEFEACGVKLVLPELDVLESTLDKQRLIQRCANVVPVPHSVPFDASYECPAQFPVLMKPRSGSGSRGIRVVHSAQELMAMPRDAEMLVQEFLPGEEYSVDVVTGAGGAVLAAVPRVRHKVDSGVAVVARTLHDEELIRHAMNVVTHMGLTGIANVQFKRDAEGVPKLLEVNPRVPGTISLTIASGVHMPKITLETVCGIAAPHTFGVQFPMEFKSVAVVRHLTEVLIEVDELDEMTRRHTPAPEHAA